MSDVQAPARKAHHFDTLEQQGAAASLGMWLFVAQEVLFFGGLFLAYAISRAANPGAFAAGSRLLDVTLGTTNTAVLIASSFTMVLAVRGGQLGRPRQIVAFLLATAVLGCVFLGIKGAEYAHKFEEGLVPGAHFHADVAAPAPELPPEAGEPPTEGDPLDVLPEGRAPPRPGAVELFIGLYFLMTGLHALHMIVGIVIVLCLLRPAARGRFTPENHNLLEGVGLYWHFVDIVWIFLFPMLYLVGLH